jgi:hypothetical protein
VVLVAEDPLVGKFLHALLGRHGYYVELASVPRALEMLYAGETRPDLLVTNEPWNFEPLAHRIAILYTAAMPDAGLAARFPVCRTLRKPFRNEELLESVAALISQSISPL